MKCHAYSFKILTILVQWSSEGINQVSLGIVMLELASSAPCFHRNLYLNHRAYVSHMTSYVLDAHTAKSWTFHDFSSLIDHNIFIFMVVSVSLLAQETRHNENSINASFMYV